MKQTLTRCITIAGLLLSGSFSHAQSAITINESNLAAYGMISGNVVTLHAGKNYVVNEDLSGPTMMEWGLSYPWSNRELKIENGATLTINEGAKLHVMKFAKSGSNPAGNGVFTANINGQFSIAESEIAVEGVNIKIGNSGTLSRGNWDGSLSIGDIKFSSTTSTNQIFISEGGLLKVNTLTIGNGSMSIPIGEFLIENNGTMDIDGNINMNASTVIRNNNTGYIYIDNQFELNQQSRFINCGHVYTGQAYNLNGGEIINTNYFESANAMISMGSNNGGIIRNYAYMKAKSINISSSAAAGYNSYLYNEGRIELMEKGDNVFGGHVGNITGPSSSNKKGYFILHSTNRTTIGSIHVSGNLNFYQSNASVHEELSDIFKDYPTSHNINLSHASFYTCDGSVTCTESLGIPSPLDNYGDCPDNSGSLSAITVMLAHDPDGNGTFTGTNLDNNLEVFAYIVNNDGIFGKASLTYNPISNSYETNFGSHTSSGNQTMPEQKDFSGYEFIISTIDLPLGATSTDLNALAPGSFTFTVSKENNGENIHPGGLRAIESTRLKSVQFGVQLPPLAEDKAWEKQDYIVNTKYLLGKEKEGKEQVTLTGSDPDGSIESYRISTLPNSDTAILYYNGTSVTTSTIIEDPALLDIEFLIAPPSGIAHVFAFEYTSTDNAGAESKKPAIYTITIGQNNPLSLENILLSAYNNYTHNQLTWEIIHNHPSQIQSIEIERSEDARLFINVGKVNIQAKNKAKYFFSDMNPFALNFYRVHLKDNSGKSHFSNVVNVNSGSNIDIKIYPNPTEKDINISFGSKGVYKIVLTDITGKVVYNRQISANPASTMIINNTQFHTGNYLLHITNEKGETKFEKVIIN